MGCFYMPKGQRKHFYSGDFKLEVIETMEREHLSLSEAARRFRVPDHTIVARWERHYLTEGKQGLYIERRGNPKVARETKMPDETRKDLISEIQQLRMENEYLKKLNALVLKEEQQNKKHK